MVLAVELDHEIVDGEPPQGRHQVLDGSHLRAVLRDAGRQGGIADVAGIGPHARIAEIRTHENDARIFPGRA